MPSKASVCASFPGGACPPKIKPDVADPDPAKLPLAVLISFTSVQLVPSNFSTFVKTFPGGAGGEYPPAQRAAVTIPKPAGPCLPVFKLFTSVQLEPSQVSVYVNSPVPGSPP